MPLAVPLLLLAGRPGAPGRDVPVTPDADEARRWAEEELAKGIYHQQESWLRRLWNDLVEFVLGFFARAGEALAGTPPFVTVGIVLAVVALVVVLALLVGGRVQRGRAARAAEADVVLEADDRSAGQLTRAADDAAARGDLHAAVLQRFRAIIRDLDERSLLEDRPGLTAREATRLAAVALPHLAGDFADAADLFCDVRYGHREPTVEDDAGLRRLAASAASAARPGARRATAGAGWSTPGGDA